MLGFRPKIPHSYLSLCTWTLETFRRGHHRQDSLDTGSYVSTHPSCGAPPFRKLQNFELRSRVCVWGGNPSSILCNGNRIWEFSQVEFSSNDFIRSFFKRCPLTVITSCPDIAHIFPSSSISHPLQKQMFTQTKAFWARLTPNLSSSGRGGQIQRPMWWLQEFPN